MKEDYQEMFSLLPDQSSVVVDIREKGFVILVEGESDSQTLWNMDFPALGIPGANMFKTVWAKDLEGLTLYIHVEPDKGGETFYQTMMRSLPEPSRPFPWDRWG